jgi:hypothetical protein
VLPVTREEVIEAADAEPDEQVQEIKSDVLGIASELNRLEERLLYPSNTAGRACSSR